VNSYLAMLAARNNAEWCETVCRSHGKPGAFLPDIWINEDVTPTYYPNAVTLTSGSSAAAKQYRAIDHLTERRIPDDWTVKDSFNSLDLSDHGFRELLTAEWIYAPASLEIPETGYEGAEWAIVVDSSELFAWEIAWRGAGGPQECSLFLPSLLENRGQAMIGGFQEGKIVAGCIANRSTNVVGISNIFLPEEGAERFRAGCVAAAIRWSNGLPLVGYESGNDVVAMKALGFESIGGLTVWIRSP
jgi:hypothetical protein